MRVKWFLKTVAAVALITMISVSPLDAKGGGGGGGHGGGGGGHSSSSASSHSSVSSSKSSSSSAGYSRGAGSPSAAGSKSVASDSALSAASKHSVSSASFAKYQAERSINMKPPTIVEKSYANSNPVFTNTRSSYGGSFNTYMDKRNNSYNDYRARNPEVFVVNNNLRPNYGVYDSGFLTGMMIGQIGSNHAANMHWMATQYNQPWYTDYRNDLNEQAATNEKLRLKLAELDAEIETLKTRGETPTITELPPDVLPEIAISPEAVLAVEENSSTGEIIFLVIFFLLTASLLILFLLLIFRNF